MRQESFTSGVLFMLLSATCLSIVGLLGKIGGESLPLASLVFWRFVASLFLCILLFLCTGRLKRSLHLGNLKMHLARAFFVLGAQYSFYYYIERSTLLNGIVLLNTGPMFIPLIEWGILRKKVGKSSWIGTLISFIGVICVLQPDKEIFAPLGLIGLLAGLSQGSSQVIFGINSREAKAENQILYLFFLCTLFSAIPYLFGASTWETGTAHSFWLDLLIIGLGIASIGNQFTRIAAYRHGTPSRLAPFLYFSVLIAGIFDWTIFHKIPNILSLIGTGLVVLGGVAKIYLRLKFLKSPPR